MDYAFVGTLLIIGNCIKNMLLQSPLIYKLYHITDLRLQLWDRGNACLHSNRKKNINDWMFMII